MLLAATIVDVISSAALVTVSERSGVSLNITTDYLTPVPCGEVCKVDAKVVKVGKTIATLNVELWRVKTGQLAAQGRHIKFLSPTERKVEGMEPQAQSKL